MPELGCSSVFGYAVEFKPFTFLYALDLVACEFPVNSKNSISGYGLTYDATGPRPPIQTWPDFRSKAPPESVGLKHMNRLPILL
jgi:hypothetical protein